MFKKVFIWMMFLSILITFFDTSTPLLFSAVSASGVSGSGRLEPSEERIILGSTVKIRMLRRKTSEQQGENSDEEPAVQHKDQDLMSSTIGIGTLVSLDGEVVLITHNHWSLLTSTVSPDKVQFHDAIGDFLYEMDGEAFRQLILYRDSGTLILNAPDALLSKKLKPAQIASNQDLKSGDVANVVYHPLEQTMALSLLTVEIESMDSIQGVQVFKLRNLDGGPIQTGDSGGGVWVNGRLVGNMWMTVRKIREDGGQGLQELGSYTGYSYAADLTETQVELSRVVLEEKDLSPSQLYLSRTQETNSSGSIANIEDGSEY